MIGSHTITATLPIWQMPDGPSGAGEYCKTSQEGNPAVGRDQKGTRRRISELSSHESLRLACVRARGAGWGCGWLKPPHRSERSPPPGSPIPGAKGTLHEAPRSHALRRFGAIMVRDFALFFSGAWLHALIELPLPPTPSNGHDGGEGAPRT